MDQKHHIEISPEQLQGMGTGLVAYVKTIGADDASRMIGQAVEAGPEGKFFALFNANGAPISISRSREAAISTAQENELETASLH